MWWALTLVGVVMAVGACQTEWQEWGSGFSRRHWVHVASTRAASILARRRANHPSGCADMTTFSGITFK